VVRVWLGSFLKWFGSDGSDRFGRGSGAVPSSDSGVEWFGSSSGLLWAWFHGFSVGNGLGAVPEWLQEWFGRGREWFCTCSEGGFGSGLVRDWFDMVRAWFGSAWAHASGDFKLNSGVAQDRFGQGSFGVGGPGSGCNEVVLEPGSGMVRDWFGSPEAARRLCAPVLDAAPTAPFVLT